MGEDPLAEIGLAVGDRAEVIAAIPLAPGSVVKLQPGDEVTVERVGESACVVRVFGDQLAIAPLHALRLASRRPPAPIPGDDPVLEFLRDLPPRR